MGVEYQDLDVIFTALAALDRKNELLVLGDAQLHFDARSYVALARRVGYPVGPVEGDLTVFSFGASLGFCHTQTLDINGQATLTVDLHEDVPAELRSRFDCLLDAGVLFWCFDPAAAFRNILNMVRPGGVVVHITAISGHYGRGYYNIHPLAFEDFYFANGCEFLGASFRTKFQLWPLVSRILRKVGVRNRVTYSTEPGSAYLAHAAFNQIRFTDHFRQPFESNLLPNNVVGVLAFRKLRDGQVTKPVRTTLYGPAEARARRAAGNRISHG